MSVHVDIEAIDPESLTPKQAIVYAALKRGKNPKQIAKQMKITPAGVYGHLRALQRASTVPTNGASKTGAVSNGNGATHTTEPGGFEVAVETVQQSLAAEREVVTLSEERISEAREAIAEAQARIQAANDDVNRRTTRIEALESAAESLKVAV